MKTAVRDTDKRPSRPRTESPRSTRRKGASSAQESKRRELTLAHADDYGRELITRDGADGSLLLIDREAGTGGDERLIGHLAADEPKGNARLLCALYMEAAPERRRCRPVNDRDSLVRPFGACEPVCEASRDGAGELEVAGVRFQLERLSSRMSIPELRWTRTTVQTGERRPASLRECIATIEDYEPLCSRTRMAVELHEPDQAVSTTTLRAELIRVLDSPIVLNRALREAVLERVRSGHSSLSEIAIRCGRVKRDSRGKESGETSWLARRIGILPEGGQRVPTVWVHSDVLGLIAREGLGVSPREVELG